MAKWRNVQIFLTALVFGVAALPVAGVSAADPPGDRGYTADAADFIVLRSKGYTFRLVQSANIEKWRSVTTQTAQKLAKVTGLRFTVAAGTVPPSYGRVDGEILVYADQEASRCGYYKKKPASGCGTYSIDWWANLTNGGDEIRRGTIWLYKGSNGKSAEGKLHVMVHEAGHTMGLGHRDAPYRGKTQVMHQSSYAATDYQQGDINGLKRYADFGRRSPTGKVTSVTSKGDEFTVKGWMSDPSGPNRTISVELKGDGHGQYPNAVQTPDLGADLTSMKGDMNSTFKVFFIPVGNVEACVTLVNIGGGANKPAGCFPVSFKLPCPTAPGQKTEVVLPGGPCNPNEG